MESVSPIEVDSKPSSDDRDSDADDEGVIMAEKEEDAERIGLANEDAVVKKLKDPKLPTEDEV